jgi:hypothetical protein
VGCLFILVNVSFAVQKLFNLMQSHLSILAIELLESHLESHCLCSHVQVFLPCFPVVVSKLQVLH